MKAIEIAQLYFDLSNESDFNGIKLIFNESVTYKSRSGELYFGINDILEMQKSYHGSFKNLQWHVNTIEEIKPGIILFDFDFSGKTQDGNQIEYSGLETIIVNNGKVQHIDVCIK